MFSDDGDHSGIVLLLLVEGLQKKMSIMNIKAIILD